MVEISESEKKEYIKSVGIHPVLIMAIVIWNMITGSYFVGVIVIILLIISNNDIKRKIKIVENGIETKGVIVKKSKLFKKIKLKVEINVNGKIYYGFVFGKIDVFQNFSVDDTITVFYEEKNPKRIMALESVAPKRFLQK